MSTSKSRRWHALVRLVLGVGLAAWPISAHAQSVVAESFDLDLGAWDTSFGNHANGFNFDWSNTAHAGGTAAGEVGGVFVRVNEPTGDLSMPRIIDTGSFAQPLDLNQPLSASGMMYLDDSSDSAGLDVHIGFYNENAPTNQRLIIRISPDGNNVWRFRMATNASSGDRVVAPAAFDSVPLEFHFDWVPSGSNNGSGTVTGTVSDGVTTLTLPTPLVGANAATFDSFGVWANSASTTEPTRQQIMYFDDVTYTVPEPSSMGLGVGALLGSALLVRVRAPGRRAT